MQEKTATIDRELLAKVRRIEIRTKGIVNDVLAGGYHSVFKGRGMEFDEVRLYQPGDDIRTIDWNVTARSGQAHVKRYVEERELTVIFLVDVSASLSFGSGERRVSETAAELCACLAFSAVSNNDKVGLLRASDRIVEYIPPKKGRKHVLRVIRELLAPPPEAHGTDIAAALEHLLRIMRKRAVVFVVSDFWAEDWQKAMRVAAARHDVIAVSVTDPRERELPNVGLVQLRDAETGEIRLVDTGSAAVREAYRQRGQDRDAKRRETFRRLGVDLMDITVGEDYLETIMALFRMREKRR